MNFEFFIAWRYLFSKKKQRFVSFITFVSALGITIGVTALIVALSLINGFQKDIRDRLFQTSYHIMVLKSFSKTFTDYKNIEDKIKKTKGVIFETPVLYKNVLISYSSNTSGGIIKGMPMDKIKKEWKSFLIDGKFIKSDKRFVYLGVGVSENIGVETGDSVKVFFPSFKLSPFGPLPSSKRFKIGGIIKSGLYEFDSVSILTDIKTLQHLLNLNDDISYIGIKVDKIFEVEKIKKELEKKLGGSFMIVTWKELNKPLFSALKLEKTVMFFTIALIVFVAALNIIATLILLVIEKVKDIGILTSLGATPENIRRIFFYQGATIGVIGSIAGVVLGLIIILIGNGFQLIKVPQEVYHIGYVRFYPEIKDILIIFFSSLAITFLTTLYPSKKAAEIEPAEALREE
jgi:lipoprotein-releasing system permease protein